MDINPKLQARLDQFAKLPPAGRFAVLGVIAGLLACGYFFLMYQDAQADRDVVERAQVFHRSLRDPLATGFPRKPTSRGSDAGTHRHQRHIHSFFGSTFSGHGDAEPDRDGRDVPAP